MKFSEHTKISLSSESIIKEFLLDDPDLKDFTDELKREGVEYKEYTIQPEILSLIPKEVATKILRTKQIARELDCALAIVGGFVRDLILGSPKHDVDFIVFRGDLNELTKTISVELNGKVCKMSNKTMTTQIRFKDGVIFEFNATRKEYYNYPSRVPIVEAGTVKDDLFRRDFTINAFVMFGNKYIDVFNGYKDLQSKIIRTTREPTIVFKEDYLRMFRAIRFACTLDFDIEKKVKEGIIKNVRNLLEVPNERIIHELKLAMQVQPLKCFKLMKELKILETIFSAIEDEPLDPRIYKVKSRWEKIEKKYQIFQRKYGAQIEKIDVMVPLTILLGEVVEKSLENMSKYDIPFKKLKNMLKSLKLSRKETNKIINLSKYVRKILQLEIEKDLKYQVRKLLREFHTFFNEVMILVDLEAQTRKNINIEPIIRTFHEERKNKELYAFKLAISGHDIESTFGLKGKVIGEIKKELEIAIIYEKIQNTRDDCLEYVERYVKRWN